MSPARLQRVEGTIRALSEEIAADLSMRRPVQWTESLLRRELTCCVLGSQVRYEQAIATTAQLEEEGLLSDEAWQGENGDAFETAVFNVLTRKHAGRRYRFPRVRARQLDQLRRTLAVSPLSERLRRETDPRAIRRQLVRDLAGVGPKQSSMFLRNVGVSEDLAILDRHVLGFVRAAGLWPEQDLRIAGLRDYERVEQVVIGYAQQLGYPVGYVDLAIWATMKAAQEVKV